MNATMERDDEARCAAQLRTFAARIPADTPDVRLAVKRECWLRGWSMVAVAAGLGMNRAYIERVFMRVTTSDRPFQRLTPALLQRVIDMIGVPAARGRELHLLGARDAGWKL